MTIGIQLEDSRTDFQLHSYPRDNLSPALDSMSYLQELRLEFQSAISQKKAAEARFNKIFYM